MMQAKVLWKLTGGFFGHRAGWMWLSSTTLLCVVNTSLNVYSAVLTREYLDALTSKAEGAFYAAITAFAVYVAVCVPFYAVYTWVLKAFATAWRQWLVELYVKKTVASHYELFVLREKVDQVENVDVRIIDDIHTITDVSATMLDALVGKVMSLVSFAWMLYTISPALVLVLIAYSFVSTLFLSGYFGTPLAQLNRLRADLVGRLRLGLLAVRNQSESVAFFRAEGEEMESIEKKSRELSFHDMLIAAAQRNFAFLDYGYQWSSGLVPPLLLAPRFFRGEIAYGMIAQGGRAFRECFDSFSVVVQNMASLASLSASLTRLKQLDDALEAIAFDKKEAEVSSAKVWFEDDPEMVVVEKLHLRLSRKHILPEGLSFSWGGRAGERGLLICGESGVGKTSLLRCLARLFWQGSGLVRGPVSNVLFLTQRPFISPLLPTLRALLTYSLRDKPRNSAVLNSALERVNLGKFVGHLDDEVEWSTRLSPGEAQRLSFARALVWADSHQGSEKTIWIFFDEATSALDESNEARLMDLVSRLPCVKFVSVAHRLAIRKYHDTILTLQPVGWTFERNAAST